MSLASTIGLSHRSRRKARKALYFTVGFLLLGLALALLFKDSELRRQSDDDPTGSAPTLFLFYALVTGLGAALCLLRAIVLASRAGGGAW